MSQPFDQPPTYVAPAHPQPEPPPPPPSGSNSWLTCLVGCAVVSLVLLLVCAGGLWWVYVNSVRLATNFVETMMIDVIDQSELTPEDKQEVKQQIGRVADAYREGRIDNQDLGRIMDDLSKSPIMSTLVVFGIEEQYIKRSGLSEEEKTAARRTLQRTVRGMVEGKLKEQDLQPIIDSISVKDAQGQQQLKERITDQELRDVLAKLQALADDAAVPDEEYGTRVGEEFKKVIDKALEGK